MSAKALETEPPDEFTTAHSESTVIRMDRGEPLHECVRNAVRAYLGNMSGHDVEGLYRLVMDEVERPLIETVFESTNQNQSVTARTLGISRSTLRKKLAAYAAADGSDGPSASRR